MLKFLYTTIFPATGLDSMANPTAGELLENAVAGLDHDTQHSNANDAIEALEAKVGVNSSAVTTSHDYKLSEVTSTDKAVGKTATQTLTNKTLTSPILNLSSNATGDIYFRKSDGTLDRLPIGTSGNVIQVSAGGVPEWVANPSGSNASETDRGLVEEATDAEVTAGTAIGATGAKLFVTPAKLITVSLVATISLTATEIKALHTAPKTLVAAPGVGKIVIVDQIIPSLTFVTPAYTNNGALSFFYDTLTTSLVAQYTNIAATANNISYCGPDDTSTNLTGGDNKAVIASASGTAYLDGNSTLKLFIKYRIITL